MTAALATVFLLSAPVVPGESGASAPAATRESPGAAMNRALTRGFGNRDGAGVVLDVAGGGVLAANNLTVAARRLALPASTIKPFVLAALLDSGKLRLDEAFICPMKLEIDGVRLDCPHPENTHPMLPGAALAYSCNNFFAKYATRLTATELSRALSHWGFTSTTHMFRDEVAGEIMTARTPGELERQALGEFGIHVTPLEVLQAYRRLALRRRNAAARNESLNVVLAALEGSVTYGMAGSAKTQGLSVAGKTGTSVAEDGNGSHGWFAGYAPADAPQIAVVIFLERGRGPGDAAAIAHDVFTAYLKANPRK